MNYHIISQITYTFPCCSGKGENTTELKESMKEPADRKIRPKLIKRFSMRELSYDISFDSPCLKVTNC